MSVVDSVRVRMYRQGLGDCFLLTATVDGAARHVLIDFGVLLGTPDAQAVMRQVAASIKDTTGGHLDVLVATHEHWDHLSGFVQAQDILSTLTVGEVWLAWTEDPGDPLAKQLRAERDRGIRAVTGAATALRAAGEEHAEGLFGILDFFGDVGLTGGSTTGAALEWVRRCSPTVRYLSPGTTFATCGIRVYVLAPPRDRVQLHRSDPSRAGAVYTLTGTGADEGFLSAAESLLDAADPGQQPFDPYFRLDQGTARQAPLIGQEYLSPENGWRRIDQDWLGAADTLALDLDSHTNNTSLVLAFEVGHGGILLFPADAQVGSWLSWQDVTFAPPGGPVTGPELLARTRLYKVGHHGSHNATLRDKGLELMVGPDLVAMLPVNRVTAAGKRWTMPLPGLLSRLEERTKGRVLDAELGRPAAATDARSAAVWPDFVSHTDVQPLWIDHTVEWDPAVPR